MPIARITALGGDLYHVHVIDAGHPDQGLPGYGGRPDQGLPGQRPPHVGGRPPGNWEGRPDQGLPGHPGFPDHELPDNPPPTLLPGYTLVMVRGPAGKWEYAFIAPSDPPPKPLPPLTGAGRPDQGLPGQPGMPPRPDQGLPGQRPPHVSGQPVPPPGTPTNPIAPGGPPPVAGQPPMPGTGPVPPQPTPAPQNR
jgi:hypothetical protein